VTELVNYLNNILSTNFSDSKDSFDNFITNQDDKIINVLNSEIMSNSTEKNKTAINNMTEMTLANLEANLM
jgi:hypothetical protein